MQVTDVLKIAPPPGSKLAGAWWAGGARLMTSFSDGTCYFVDAPDFPSGRPAPEMHLSACAPPIHVNLPHAPAPPQGNLRAIGFEWGYGAWGDDATGTTIVAPPAARSFDPLFRAQMQVSSIMAMDVPDAPVGTVTLIGTVEGELMAIRLAVAY